MGTEAPPGSSGLTPLATRWSVAPASRGRLPVRHRSVRRLVLQVGLPVVHQLTAPDTEHVDGLVRPAWASAVGEFGVQLDQLLLAVLIGNHPAGQPGTLVRRGDVTPGG